MDPSHVLRPSNAYRWARCSGSHALEARYPEETESEEAREGTAAHWYVTEAVQGRVHPAGTLAPNGYPLNDEMIECGELFVDVASHLPITGVEEPVTMHGLIHPLNEGTPDAYAVSWSEHKIWLVDYKYGHRYVDPFENDQCLDYVAGVVERLELTQDDFKGWEVEIIIVQPRNYHRSGPVRRWKLLGHQAWRHFERLALAAHEAVQPNAPTQTGDHCRDCKARHACEALLRVGQVGMDMAGSSVPNDLDGAALGLVLTQTAKAIARLEALYGGLEQVGLAKVRAGERVPGWTIERGTGRERWTKPVPEVKSLGELMGVPLTKEVAITPNQARKAGIDATVIRAYSEIPGGKHTLAKVDDNDAARAFGEPSQ